MFSGVFTSLRSVYPEIFHMTYTGLNRWLSEIHEPELRAWLESVYKDAQRAMHQTQLKGWSLQFNPFLAMDLDNWHSDIPDNTLSATHDMIVKANAWLGIGVWTLVEEYFQKALYLAFKSNNFMAALQVGVNLGLSYLAAGDDDSALRLISQALPAAVQIKNWSTVHRMGTVQRLCLARTGRWDLVAQETQKLRQMTQEADLASLEEFAFEIVADIYRFTDAPSNLRAWEDEWRKLKASTTCDDTRETAKPAVESGPAEKLVKSFRREMTDLVDLEAPQVVGNAILSENQQSKTKNSYVQNQLNETIREFQAALWINPDDPDAHTNLGRVYGQLGRLDEAVRQYQAALRVDPDHVLAHTNLAAVYGKLGRLEEGIREFEAALHIDPNHADAHANLGIAYSQQGRLDEAIREFQAVLRIQPDYAEAHYHLGTIYSERLLVDDAIREYQSALDSDPAHTEAHCGLGKLYYVQGRLVDAIGEFVAVLSIKPDHAEAHTALGLAYQYQGRLDEAVREYEATLALNPNDGETHYMLGGIYADLGRWEAAQHEIRIAAQLGFKPAQIALL